MDGQQHTIELSDATVSATTWGSRRPEIVLLHDGLGSVAQWRSVPARVAEATGRTVLAYDRPGHGTSTPTPTGPWPPDWLHTEARRLGELLAAVDADRPLLVGHSDGGSIVLIHAADGGLARAVLALAPHSWVEAAAVNEIEMLRANADAIVNGLARHHAHPADLFTAWSEAWTGQPFADSFDIRPDLARIAVPVEVVQGTADEFATEAQAIETTAAIGPATTCTLLPGVRHLIHHDDPAMVADLITRTDRAHPPR